MGRGWTGGGSAAGAASVYNLRLPPKASGEDTGAGPAPGFMRLTPDSRAPAKADPSAWAGFEFDPGGSQLGRGCAYLGLGWRHLGGFTKLLLWLLLVLVLLFLFLFLLLLLRWSSLFFWCGVTDALGVVLASPCVRRGPGLRASRQHPSSEGGWQPGCTWRTPKSGEPSCTLSLRKREKQASTLATFVVTRGRCERISSSGPRYCLSSLNPSQWSSI